ncbi:capsular polysaccharide synthesis protein [Micrococcus sp. XM4230A]|uniref:capsular polysaccharide synthesis protein n=1 Tax=unclassified Micrococcus TaxID=2620948 RepID=UPI001FF994A2|nr:MULTISPECIES: capsular polysaccharide synthesis protein [unclassified Micrococcus]MCK1799886.1 capsular polysaccharide synthesis protein [Micrococcus sp. XM4230B]MCK1811147.1 capsular polysaccharide synthesis protein [Micrococcus sp. XM4230A]
MRPLDALRRGKHAAYVVSRALRRRSGLVVHELAERGREFVFDSARYPEYRFLRHDVAESAPREFPHRIFVLWTGTNALPDVRLRNLELLRQESGVPVKLITPDTLGDWVVEGHPLHPALGGLSLTHRSDYLRAYLLHHHGGGYCDIKTTAGPWVGAFATLDAEPRAWAVTYQEDSPGRLPSYAGRLHTDLRRRFHLVRGTSAMIARPHTPWTAEWLGEVERRMDYFADLLSAHPGGIRDEAAGYPVGWTQLLADILYPLSLKYSERLLVDPALVPSIEDYR